MRGARAQARGPRARARLAGARTPAKLVEESEEDDARLECGGPGVKDRPFAGRASTSWRDHVRVTLIIAEFATALPNGLFTLVNGGVDTITTAQPKGVLQGYLLVRIQQEAPEGGKHALKITLMDQDGNAQSPPVNMSFETQAKTGATAIALSVSASLAPGDYAFHAVMNNQLLASAPLRVVRLAPPKRPNGRGAPTSGPEPAY